MSHMDLDSYGEVGKIDPRGDPALLPWDLQPIAFARPSSIMSPYAKHIEATPKSILSGYSSLMVLLRLGKGGCTLC